MKNSTKHATKLKPFLKKLGAGTAIEHAHDDDPVGVLIFSTLLAGATVQQALVAYQTLLDQIVDFNDLRVCMPHEIVELIGKSYPDADDHARRLRAALRSVYLREHEMTMVRVTEMGKRETRAWVESLEGALPYTKARLLLCSFDVHSIPVDEQMLALLIEAGVADPSVDADGLGGWLTRQVASGDGLAVHQALQAWSDVEFEKSLRRKQRRVTSKKKARGKKTTAKAAKATTSKSKTSKASAAKKTRTSTSKKKVVKKTTRASSKKSTTKKTTRRRAGTGG